MLVQSGRPVGVMQTHEWAPRVLIANSNLVGDWANWSEFRRLEQLGLTMYGQMTAGSWIYIGTQGILQGTYETFAAVAAKKRFGGTLAGTITLTGGVGRHGRRPAARGHDERRCRHRRRRGRQPHRPPHRAPLPRRARPASIDEALELAERGRDADRRALSIGLVGNAAEVFPARAEPRRTNRRCDRSDQRPRPARLPRRSTSRSRSGMRPGAVTRKASSRLPAHPWRARWRRWSASSASWRRGVRLRQQPAHRGARGRVCGGVRLPGLRPRLHPSAVRRGQGSVPLGGALRRPGRHRRHRSCRARAVPRERATGPLDQARRRAGALPGTAGPDLLARLRRARPSRAPVQRHGRLGRAQGADRDRPRPPRRRVGGLALPRDRGDARRLGRDRRLAAAERAA